MSCSGFRLTTTSESRCKLAYQYGRDIYLTNGSHGCVNTPYTEAEKVFNAIEIGDPVIVYYSLDDVTGPQPTQKNSL